MINVCVPVLRRYDLLREMLQSLEVGSARPDMVYIINNGQDVLKLHDVCLGQSLKLAVLTPKVPMGVAESWNWFINNVSEERVITNDDILFGRLTLSKMVAQPEDLVWASGFSCFLIRDACVRKLGLFDETISPGYGYYEDDDYLQRLDGRGTKPRMATAENVDAGVVHRNSATLQAASHEELLEHHRRFKIAQGNYMRKWELTSL